MTSEPPTRVIFWDFDGTLATRAGRWSGALVEALVRHETIFADTLPVLTSLAAQGWRHVIVSNHVPELSALVEALGLGTVVDRVVTSALVGYEKPHREIFRVALALAGQPDIAWMVGDKVVADVLGAELAGIPAILVRQTDARVRRSCADLHGVPALLAGPSRLPCPTPPA